MSVIEAYSRGVPVLARKLGSYLELVEGSGAGMTFADADELERGMRALLTDDERHARMGERAYAEDATPEDIARMRHARMGERAYALFRESYSEDAVLPRYLDLVHRFRPFMAPTPALPRSTETARV